MPGKPKITSQNWNADITQLTTESWGVHSVHRNCLLTLQYYHLNFHCVVPHSNVVIWSNRASLGSSHEEPMAVWHLGKQLNRTSELPKGGQRCFSVWLLAAAPASLALVEVCLQRPLITDLGERQTCSVAGSVGSGVERNKAVLDYAGKGKAVLTMGRTLLSAGMCCWCRDDVYCSKHSLNAHLISPCECHVQVVYLHANRNSGAIRCSEKSLSSSWPETGCRLEVTETARISNCVHVFTSEMAGTCFLWGDFHCPLSLQAFNLCAQ